MWRLLPFVLLLGCAATDPNRAGGSHGGAAQARIVQTANLPLTTSGIGINGEPPDKSFQASGVSGRVDPAGFWEIRKQVGHGRLLCGVYEVGMQLGSGNPGCSDVRWLTDIQYVTRERQCNSATRIHTGRARFADPGKRFPALSCVRLVVRCEGTC